GEQQRRAVIAGADLIDVGARIEQRHHGLGVSFARREQQRGQPALVAIEIVGAAAAAAPSAATTTAAAAGGLWGTGTLRSASTLPCSALRGIQRRGRRCVL